MLFILFICFSLKAQETTLVKYYDSLWAHTSKDSAFYFTEFTKKDSTYNCTSYWAKSKKLNCKSQYFDTLFSKPTGLMLRYYESGQLQDSSIFYEDGNIKNTYRFYLNGNLWAHYSYNKADNSQISEGFDEKGNTIKNFIYIREAEFPGGKEAWQTYLVENIKTKVPLKNKAPNGTYQVIIRFIVDKNGKISNMEPETNLGYGMEEEIMRVLKKSPKWSPMILLGKFENAYRRQPITFVVSEN